MPASVPVLPPASVLEPWRARCRAAGMDPLEVEVVSSRYAAYRGYMEPQGGGLPLDEWFRFYRLEKASETGLQGGAVGGCSATGEANDQNCLTNPAAFLELLRDYLRLAGLH